MIVANDKEHTHGLNDSICSSRANRCLDPNLPIDVSSTKHKAQAFIPRGLSGIKSLPAASATQSDAGTSAHRSSLGATLDHALAGQSRRPSIELDVDVRDSLFGHSYL